MTYAELMRNLDEPYFDCSSQMSNLLVPNCYLFVYGVFYPEADDHKFEAKHIVFLGRKENEYLFEKQDWWVKQVKALPIFT